MKDLQSSDLLRPDASGVEGARYACAWPADGLLLSATHSGSLTASHIQAEALSSGAWTTTAGAAAAVTHKSYSDACEGAATFIASNLDGSRVVTTSSSGVVKVWSPADMTASHVASADAVWRAAPHPLLPLIAAVGMGRTDGRGNVLLHSLSEGTERFVSACDGEFLRCLAFSNDGSKLAVGSASGMVAIIDVAEARVLSTIEAADMGVRSLVFHMDDSVLYTAADDWCINAFDVSSGALINSFTGHLHWVTCIAAATDGSLLTSCAMDETVRVWDLRKRAQVGYKNAGAPVWSVCLNPANTFAAYTTDKSALSVVDVRGIV